MLIQKAKGQLKFPMLSGMWMILGVIGILIIILVAWSLLQGRIEWKIFLD